MTSFPKIAITGMWSNKIHGLRHDGNAVAAQVLRSVIRAGGEPLTLFAESGLSSDARLAGFDGLLVPGGADVDPARYGQTPHPNTATADFPAQDVFESTLMHAALQMGMPVLAICRGFQLLNVEFGGTLVQDLPEETLHRNSHHEVDILQKSRLAEVIGATSINVSSYHHQAIETLGEGLVAVGTAPDGIIEAFELPNAEMIAIQWHPEDTAAVEPQQHALFAWLVDQAAAYRENRGR